MTYIILIFGILVLLGGLIILIKPDYIISIFRKFKNSFGFHFIAVIARIILGIALITGSCNSKYPLILQILGWFTLAAALVLGLMGRKRFIKMIEWTVELSQTCKRIMGFFGILFGCFIIYAVI
ncbi:hypothetical protein ACFL6W_02080 [Thermodesulfobacteriota bacterium]